MVEIDSILTGHAAPIYGASWDGHFLYTSAGDRYVTRWDLSTGTQDASFTVKLDSTAFVIKNNASTCFIGCSDGTLLAVDTTEKKLIWQTNQFGNSWFSLELNSTENWLMGGDDEGNLLVVDASSGKQIIHLPLAAGKIRNMRLFDKRLFVCTQLIGVLVFDVETWNETNAWEPNENGVIGIEYDANSKHFITIGKDAHIAISDLQLNVLKRIPAHYQNIYQLIRLSDYWVTCSMDKTIKLWNNDFSSVLQKMDVKSGAHNRSVNNLVCINDKTFVSVGDDKKIIVWKQKQE